MPNARLVKSTHALILVTSSQGELLIRSEGDHSCALWAFAKDNCDHKRTALRQLRAPGVAIPAPVDANENHEAENVCAKQNHHGGQREGWPKNPCCLLEHETTEIRVAAIKVARMAISCGNQ
ncbi:unnamed protein product [Fusarium fujikuroi]|nr:unnamed protein product [Fusarium fujikuroi]